MELVIAIVGSGALSALIAGIFNLVVNRRGRIAAIEEKLDTIAGQLANTEKDELRTQLLLMISDYPIEQQEILKLAEHYFKDLEGNWYASTLFQKWLDQNHVVCPQWFKGGAK